MLANSAMEMQREETPLALQRLWNLTRARLAGTSTAIDVEPAFVENFPPAQVRFTQIPEIFVCLFKELLSTESRYEEMIDPYYSM